MSSDFSGSSRIYVREKNEWILFFITFITLTGEVLGAIISIGTGLSLTAKRWDGFHLLGALTPFAHKNISQYDIFFFFRILKEIWLTPVRGPVKGRCWSHKIY